MDLPFDYEPLTPEQMEKIDAALKNMKESLLIVRSKIIQDNIKHLGGMTPEVEAQYRERQAERIDGLVKAGSAMSVLAQKIEDTILVLNYRLFERAKMIHQALREASKTDPSLNGIVAELDALYEDALREQEEEDADAQETDE